MINIYFQLNLILKNILVYNNFLINFLNKEKNDIKD